MDRLKNKVFHILAGAVFLLTLISLACNLPAGLEERFFGEKIIPTVTPLPTNTPQPLPPTIVETEPAAGSTIPLQGSLIIYFNQAMDQGSVENALIFDPGSEGTLSWVNPSTAAYTPNQPLEPNSQLNLQLNTKAKAANGLSLLEDIHLVYYAPDTLKPTHFLPSQGAFEINPASAVVVTFNQPVVPLGASSQDLPAAFSISPAVPGTGEWINTSTYQFTPESGLAGGVTYTASLSSTLRSTAGAPLDSESVRSWTFSTIYPQLLDWQPIQGATNVYLDEPIKLIFNQAMDPDSVAANLKLISPDGQPVRGELEWTEDFTEAEFIPDDLYARETWYATILPAETKAAGGTPLGIDTTWQFHTVGDFRFFGTPGGQYYTTSIYDGVTLYFNSYIDKEDILEKITIFPEVTNLRTSLGESGNVLKIYGDFEPLTDYSLFIQESLSDKWGRRINGAISINFSTEALRSNLFVSQGSQTLFVTGSENAIPAEAANLYQIAINVGTIPLKAYSSFFGQGSYVSLDTYFPPDVQYWNHIVSVPGDDSHSINLPLNQTGTSIPPGLYRYQIYSQELPYNPPPYLVVVSNIHLMMKASPYNILIWAVDLETGLSIQNAIISIYDDTGKEVFSGTTNQDGFYEVEFSSPVDLYDTVYYAVAGSPGEEGFGLTASDWAFGVQPWNFGISSDYGAPQPRTYLYTDRPIYRPGQKVYYRLVHRDVYDGGYLLPDDATIQVSIDPPRGEPRTETIPLSEFGTAYGEYQLSTYAQPGYYRLDTEYGFVYFQVAEYRKPEIDLQVTIGPDETIVEDDWQGSVDARYYFDAPAGEVPINWSLRAEQTYFSLPGYRVGVLENRWFLYSSMYFGEGWGTLIDSGEDETDLDGTWSIQQPLTDIDNYDQEIVLPANYVLRVTAQDESGFQITNRAEILVHPSDFYIGVKPSAWIAEADDEVNFEVLVVDWNKKPDGVHRLQAELNRVSWKSETGEYGDITYEKVIERVETKTLSTRSNGEGEVNFTPPEPGTYQVDIFGDDARTEVTLWVGGPGRTAWPKLTNQKIRLIADNDSYLPGEQAEIFIPNPFPDGAQALITIERHKVISYQSMSITSSGETIQIPLTEEDAPNVYVSVTLLGQNQESIVDFRQGYINLLVEPIDHMMKVEIVGEPEVLAPREEVQFTIRVTDSDGKPLVGEFTLAVVDKAILALADPNSQEIKEAFFGIQPLGVRAGIPLGMHAGREVFIPGGMGGGGGDGEAYLVRSQFEDTSYWSADVVTNERGIAVVTVTLPDNLTTWQAEARGVTKDTEVGQGATEVVATKDLLIRPVTPRFLVAGDHLALAALVHNNTDADLVADVTLQGTGIILDIPDFALQTVEIPAEGRTRVEWWVTVEDAPEADLLISADAGRYTDAVKPYLGPLPISRYTAPQTFGTSGVLEDPGQRLEIVTLPKTFDPDQGALDIELSPSLAAALLTALDAMEEKPHLSTMSKISRFLPNVVTYQTLQELDLDYPDLESRLETIIPETLDALAGAQNQDGGWGWWKDSPSDVEISSYILYGLTTAEGAGIFVEDLMIEQAIGYLLSTLPSVDMLNEPWQYNQLAFRYFALSEAGIETRGGLLDLVNQKSQMSPYAQAFLAMALETQDPGSSEAQTIFSNLVGTGVRTATGIHWENPGDCRCWLNNTSTTTAIVTFALAREDAAAGTLPEAVRYLVSTARPQGDWWSPYETGWAILALNEVMKSTGDLAANFTYTSEVNGTEVISGQADGSAQLDSVTASIPVVALYAEDPNALYFNHGEGDGSLYYKAHLFVSRPAQDVPPFGKGMSISRVYARLNPDGTPVFTQSGEIGELLQVQLTLVLENDVHYLMVEDKIPSGAEVLDTRLKTTDLGIVDYPVVSPFRNGWGWWYFNAPIAYDDRVSWSASYLPAGTYQLTYTLSLVHPGEYQVLPARSWNVYFPETQAVSAGEKFVIHAD